MTEPKKELKSLIYRKFDTEKECAEALGWPRQRLNKMVIGKKEPSVSEVVAIANVVGEPLANIAHIFLKMSSPNG